MIKEIRADATKYGDERRTLVEEAARAGITQTVLDEAVTVIVSEKGWVRCRSGHGVDLANLAFKDGDRLAAAFECRSVDALVALTDGGRALTVAVSTLPDGRGNGSPLASLVELPSGAKIAHVLAGKADRRVLLATSDGYGFLCNLGDMTATKRAGKQFMSVDAGARILAPVLFEAAEGQHLPAAPLGELGRRALRGNICAGCKPRRRSTRATTPQPWARVFTIPCGPCTSPILAKRCAGATLVRKPCLPAFTKSWKKPICATAYRQTVALCLKKPRPCACGAFLTTSHQALPL